jgi:hypothetical protein
MTKTRTGSEPRYRLSIQVSANGRPGKAIITAVDANGHTLHTDKADLTDARERQKLAKRLAEALDADATELLDDLEREWNKLIDEHRRMREQAEKGSPEAAPEPPCSPCSPGSVYEERGHRIYLRKHTREAGDYLEPLANFTARITGEDVIDDGSGEVRHVFGVEGTLHNGTPLPAAVVPAGDFSGMSWVLKAWGSRANTAAGLGAKDHLRAAIQELSGDPPRRVVYQHTGWRQEAGRRLYLHGAGAIGPDGAVRALCVELAGKLAHYSLPPPPVGAALVEAIRADLRLLGLAPPRLMYPLLGAIYRAVLGTADCSLSLIGKTGLGKSELAALAQQHYGAEMHRLNLPGNWTSTANALEGLAFLAKDALLVIDDFKPGGSRSEIDGWHAKADRVLRAQGNSSARQRCRADGSVRADRPPRGLILMTGEDTPRGESLRARNLSLLVRPGDVEIACLTPFQRDAAGGLYAQALAGFIRWIAPRYEQARARLGQEHAELRGRALSAESHPRTPGIVADLALGLKAFLDFAQHAGAITPPNRDALERQGWQALLEAAAEQTQEVQAQDPARRFLRLLAAALASGRAHVVGADGTEPRSPNRPEAWGWRTHTVGAGEHARSEWQPQGRGIGWVHGEGVFLDPDAAYAEAQRFGDDQGERLPLSQHQLYRQLKDQGLLERTEEKKTTIRVTLQGALRPVVHLRKGLLCPQEQGEQGE